jgi:hypothetical protein
VFLEIGLFSSHSLLVVTCASVAILGPCLSSSAIALFNPFNGLPTWLPLLVSLCGMASLYWRSSSPSFNEVLQTSLPALRLCCRLHCLLADCFITRSLSCASSVHLVLGLGGPQRSCWVLGTHSLTHSWDTYTDASFATLVALATSIRTVLESSRLTLLCEPTSYVLSLFETLLYCTSRVDGCHPSHQFASLSILK